MLEKQWICIKIKQRIKNDFAKAAGLFYNVEHNIPDTVLVFSLLTL